MATTTPGSLSLRGRRLPLRFTALMLGLLLYGGSLALTVEASLGLSPWDVFHQGIADWLGLSIGTVVIVVSAFVLVLWIPLRQRPGIGTLANAVVVGLAVDATLAMLPTPEDLWVRIVFLISGVVLNGVATGLYIGARLGPGPRDGLMTVIAALGYPISIVRGGIELTVLAVGWMLGGQVGLGTVVYAMGIGPLAQFFLPRLTVAEPGVGTVGDDQVGAPPADG